MATDDQMLDFIRARARRLVQIMFASLALASLLTALLMHNLGPASGPRAQDSATIANAFMFLGLAYAITQFVWDWMFPAKR